METPETVQQIFSTRDIYLASTLITLGFFMCGVDVMQEGDKNQKVGWFKFHDSEELQEAKSKYQQSLLRIDPKLFITSMHSLKSEISNIFNNPHLS